MHYLAALPAVAETNTWDIDGKVSKVQFFTKNGTSLSASGSFKDLTGAIEFDASNLDRVKVSAKIPLSTIKTGIDKRDEDLKSVDYFDVGKFAYASFVSTGFARPANQAISGRESSSQNVGGKQKGSKLERRPSKKQPGKYILSGKFTLHGISKMVEIVMDLPKIQTDKSGKSLLSAVGSTTVDQKDFDLTLKKLHPDGYVWINSAIAVVITIQAVKH